MRFLVILFIASSHLGVAQNFSAKTNAIDLSFEKEIKSTLPEITWISPAYESSNSQNTRINIEANISSTVELQDVSLIIKYPDGEEAEKKYDLKDQSFTMDLSQPISLQNGQYTLTLVASNISGGKVFDSRQLNIGLDAVAEAVSMDRKDMAILFATDKYDYWTDLVNPIYDANIIAQELKKKYGFEIEVVENATQEEVFIKLADYSQKTYKPQDQLMVFFAGHGYFDETFGEGYVVAKNSLENDRAKTSFISHNRLRSIINNIPCEHILLTMDVCFGGTFDPVIASERSAATSISNDDKFLARKLSYKTRKYLTSGGKTYVSDGVQGKHSPFAQKVLQALKDGGGNDKILTLSEIKPYIEKLIPEPRLGSFGDDNIASDFVFVRRLSTK